MTILRVKSRNVIRYIISTTKKKLVVVEHKRLFKSEKTKCRKERDSLMLECT
ncbi:hypothetical protein HanXRQr2_Chr11g0477491 [Helianthus annuus]|uniref:Uncharacterized protein n=1 Tax=Helianthus annuus TaxID=4232 RepID=A0A9K3MYY2_HELAN|nr:hypothetical protein HanXRQr2_Chr11g0477491 [Helianthus annuus]KAJ0874112.1 hypothetical protein HanPSC8_Chr11g0460271 [Helianthus annuus]